jgi:hypothetical protein
MIYRVSQGLHGGRLAPVSAERWVISQPLGRSAPAPGVDAEAG